MFWENFVRLCSERDTKPNPVAKELGFSSGSVTDWKNGKTPRPTTIQKIADYFGVTVEDLLQEKKPPAAKAEEDAEVEEDELTELLQELKTRPEMKMLFSLAKGATKEDVELAVQIIERMRRQGGDGE